MDLIEEISSLPETVPSEEVDRIARALILTPTKGKDHIRPEDILDALSELSEIQWRNYERLGATTEKIIEDYITGSRLDCIESKIEEIITIIDRLGLQRAFEYLSQLWSSGNLSETASEIFAEYREEAGGNISNPYKNYWK